MTYGPFRGTVDLVHDGDTIDIALDVGFDITIYARVRVFGINAPELSTDAGKAARDYARSLLPVGEQVSVISHGWDKYGGRVDGEILFGAGDNFATAMLDSGHAVPFKA